MTFSETGNSIFVLGFFIGLLDCCVEFVLVHNVIEFDLAFFQLFYCVVHLSSMSARDARIYIL